MKSLSQSLRDGDESEVVQAWATYTTDEISKLMPTMHDDTILHMAIYMGKESIALRIIEVCRQELITKPNEFGNTALHEAAAAGWVQVVEKLLDKAPELLSTPNEQGEMPLYTAAHFNHDKIFNLLAQKLKMVPHLDLRLHFCSLYPKSDDPAAEKPKFSFHPQYIRTTILHVAIHAEFFEIALLIARRPEYDRIVQLKDQNSMTPLQLLSSNSSAFKSGMKCGWIKRIIYNCAPYEDAKNEDTDGQNSSNDNSKRSATLFLRRVITLVNRSVWNVLRAWSIFRDIYDERKRHGLALELARFLIAADDWGVTRLTQEFKKGVNESAAGALSYGETRKPSQLETPDIPLFIATSNGIIEIVEETLKVHPLSVEYTNKEKQNILHLAVLHRQSHILYRVTKMNKALTSRLAQQTDKHGFTILHYVGNMEFYNGGTQHGPALQLQEELEWYEEVKKLVPPHYVMNRSRIHEQRETLKEFFDRKYEETRNELSKNVGKIIPPDSITKLGWDESKEETPMEYFSRTHGELLEEAQKWLERASNSCSLVVALIASVAFAAAFAIPGGNNGRNGQPILIDSPFFLVFIITDALSIASSLMSLAMFLYILSSPCELHDFRHSLPRKLTLGFTSLFFSVALTSLAFASTLMLTVPTKKRLTTTLIYCVACLPVTMFALLQFPLYLAFKRSLQSMVKAVKRVLPSPLIKAAARLKSHAS